MENKAPLIGVFSDTHIGNFKKFDENGSRLRNSTEAVYDIIRLGVEAGIDIFYFAGDLADTPKVLEINVAVALVELASRIERDFPNIKIYAIDGNHDHHEKNLGHRRSLSSLDVVVPVMQRTLVDITKQEGIICVSDNVYVHGIPYYEIKADFIEALEQKSKLASETGGKHHLLIHQTPKMFDSIIPYDIDPNDALFDAFEMVFCGHIHAHMQLAPNFVVVGNNIHRDKADAGKQKGFLVFNPNNNKYKLIPLTGYPEYIVVEAGEEDDPAYEADYVVVKPADEAPELIGEVDSSFSVDNTSKDIVTSFWKAVDGKQEERLQVGLECLTFITEE